MKAHTHALTTAALVAAMLLSMAPAPATAGPVADLDAPTAASITLTKTVGTSHDVCANTSEITFPPGGGTAVYCYTIENTGDVTLTHHTLYDNRIGNILIAFPYNLVIGASAFITVAADITQTTVNIAEWTATLDALSVIAGDTATVTVGVASIVMTKTVGLVPDVCAATDHLSVVSGSTVYYCYTVRNTGDAAFELHDLEDDKLGTVFNGLSFTLSPGAFINSVAPGYVVPSITGTTLVNTAVWTAYNVRGPSATARDAATLTVQSATSVDVLGFDATAVSAWKCGNHVGAECARLTWHTTSEAGVAGYRLLRAAATGGGEPQRVGATAVSPLVQSAGGEGATYDWLDADTTAGTTYGYWLQRIDTAGNASESGPAIIRVRADVIDLPEPASLGR